MSPPRGLLKSNGSSTMNRPRVIVCERSRKWASAIARHLPGVSVLRQTRGLTEARAELASAPASLLVLELTAENRCGRVDSVGRSGRRISSGPGGGRGGSGHEELRVADARGGRIVLLEFGSRRPATGATGRAASERGRLTGSAIWPAKSGIRSPGARVDSRVHARRAPSTANFEFP